MNKIIDFVVDNKDWIFSGIGITLGGSLIKIIFFRRKNKKRENVSSTSNGFSINGTGNITGDGNISGNSIHGNYIAEQNVIVVKENDDKNEKEQTLFSKRFDILQSLLNETRFFAEKEYTTEYISFLLGLKNVNELKQYANGEEEPDDSFKRKFVDVFGVNEDWILFNRGEYPFAPNDSFFGDDPMDILRNRSLQEIYSFIIVVGEIDNRKSVIIITKYSDVHFEVIPRIFTFYPEVGTHGETMLVSLYRFIREAANIKKLYGSVYSAESRDMGAILYGCVPAKKAMSLPVLKGFESIILDLSNEEYDKKHLEIDVIKIKSIIRNRIDEEDRRNQEADREIIYRNLGKEEVKEKDIDLFNESTPFFSYRFAKAFPGVRGIKEFNDPKVAVDRLEILLKQPLSSSNLPGPIWWFRGSSNLHIGKFTRVGDDKFLMDSDEIKVKRIVAYSSSEYYKKFVYIEAQPEEQTGLYDKLTEDELKERAEIHQVYDEEYAVVGDKKVTRAEYDDGAAIIDGKSVDISGKAKLRVRYLTPYNFLICAQFNPINNSSYDSEIEMILNKLLKEETEITDLVLVVKKMKRHRNDMLKKCFFRD